MNYGERPAISGKGIKLMPLSRYNIQDLFLMQNNVDEMYLWTASRDILTESQLEDIFINRLSQYYHVYLLIYNENNDCCGLIYSYDYNVLDGFTYTTIYLQKEFRNQGVAQKSGMLFFDYLFTYYPIRKIYCDVIAYNEHSRHFLQKSGMAIEGELKQHKFYAGKYYDVIKFSMFRENFYKIYSDTLQQIKSSTSAG